MQQVRPHLFGMAFGLFVGLVHVLWAALVLTGLAQPWLDFVFRMHMITPVVQVAPFSLGRALGLILITTVVGYVFGFVLGAIWNRLATQRS